MEREQLIEAIGIQATDKIKELEDQINELHEFLGVIRVAHTFGFKLAKHPSKE